MGRAAQIERMHREYMALQALDAEFKAKQRKQGQRTAACQAAVGIYCHMVVFNALAIR